MEIASALSPIPEGVPPRLDASVVGLARRFHQDELLKRSRDRIAFISMGGAMSYGELDLKSHKRFRELFAKTLHAWATGLPASR